MVIKEGFVIKMTVIKTRSSCISDLMDNSQGLVILEMSVRFVKMSSFFA